MNLQHLRYLVVVAQLVGAPSESRWGLVDGWLLGAGRAGDVAVEVTRRDMITDWRWWAGDGCG